MDTRQHIENNIRRLRLLRGERLEDLGVALGVDPSTVGRWERGTREVPDVFKVAIAHHFGWPVHAVFLFDTSSEAVAIALKSLCDRLEATAS